MLVLFLLSLAVVPCALGTGRGTLPEVMFSDPETTKTASSLNLGAELVYLKLCECEVANGFPSGLGCGKEGWFISNFEHQGTWMGGGGLVPLSHAICCRPCIPGELPTKSLTAAHAMVHVGERGDHSGTHALSSALALPHGGSNGISDKNGLAASLGSSVNVHGDFPYNAAGSGSPAGTLAGGARVQKPCERLLRHRNGSDGVPDAKPLAVVSIGCHASSGRGYRALQCESSGHSFVTGFSQAERVSSYHSDIYYPVGQAECCTPAILLSTGDVWKVKRCDCTLSHTKDCGGLETGRLLWGFASWKITRAGDYLPVAPLDCCGLCLGDQIHDGTCEDLSFCSGNGICSLGACECFEGYSGADCSASAGSGGRLGLPWWATALIIGGTLLLMSASSIAMRYTYHIMRASGSAGPGGAGGPLAAPLLGLEDDNGSAGSHDTSEEEEEEGGGPNPGGPCARRPVHGQGPGEHSLLGAGSVAAYSGGGADNDGSGNEGGSNLEDSGGGNAAAAATGVPVSVVTSGASGLFRNATGGRRSRTPAGGGRGRAGGSDTGGGAGPAAARNASLDSDTMFEMDDMLAAGASHALHPSQYPCGQRWRAATVPEEDARDDALPGVVSPGLSLAIMQAHELQQAALAEAEARADQAEVGTYPNAMVATPAVATPPHSTGAPGVVVAASVALQQRHGSSSGWYTVRAAPAAGPPLRPSLAEASRQEVAPLQQPPLPPLPAPWAEYSYAASQSCISDVPSEAHTSTDLCAKALAHGPVAHRSAMCAVCFAKPIQVTLVPCGHANVCRRCSRRLQRCPFCRRDILRRQRLFLNS